MAQDVVGRENVVLGAHFDSETENGDLRPETGDRIEDGEEDVSLDDWAADVAGVEAKD